MSSVTCSFLFRWMGAVLAIQNLVWGTKSLVPCMSDLRRLLAQGGPANVVVRSSFEGVLFVRRWWLAYQDLTSMEDHLASEVAVW